MVLEFAPLGALDRILANYKRAGARLNAYVMQKCIVQVNKSIVRTSRLRKVKRTAGTMSAHTFGRISSTDMMVTEALLRVNLS